MAFGHACLGVGCVVRRKLQLQCDSAWHDAKCTLSYIYVRIPALAWERRMCTQCGSSITCGYGIRSCGMRLQVILTWALFNVCSTKCWYCLVSGVLCRQRNGRVVFDPHVCRVWLLNRIYSAGNGDVNGCRAGIASRIADAN